MVKKFFVHYLFVILLMVINSKYGKPFRYPPNEFTNFLIFYGYQLNETEYYYRLPIFQDNKNYIEHRNALKLNYVLGYTPFTHMDISEYKMYLQNQNSEFTVNSILFNETTEESMNVEIDYRDLGIVSPSKDHERNKNSWLNVGLKCLESQHNLHSNKNLTLSESWVLENILDGRSDKVRSVLEMFKFAKKYGVYAEERFPQYSISLFRKLYYHIYYPLYWVDKIYKIQGNNEKALNYALLKFGPVAVAMDASHRDFQFYTSGIYDNKDCSKSDPNLFLLLVGTKVQTEKYYILQNSWGKHWGNSGYLHLSRDDNMCGIANHASLATVTYKKPRGEAKSLLDKLSDYFLRAF